MGGVGGQSEVPYNSVVGNETAYLSVAPPLGASFLLLHGVVGDEYGEYEVSVTPEPPYPLNTTKFDAGTRWTVLDETLFIATLDPEVQYVVEISGDADGAKLLGLSGYTFCVVPSL